MALINNYRQLTQQNYATVFRYLVENQQPKIGECYRSSTGYRAEVTDQGLTVITSRDETYKFKLNQT